MLKESGEEAAEEASRQSLGRVNRVSGQLGNHQPSGACSRFLMIVWVAARNS